MQIRSTIGSLIGSKFGIGVAAFGMVALCCGQTAQAQSTIGFLYVTDYGAKNLLRYSYTFDYATGKTLTPFVADGATAGSAVLISGNIKEGLQGTATDLIIVEGNGNTIGRYTLNGTKIADIPVTGFQAATGNAQSGFSTVGNVAITADGKYMYAPDESAGWVYKIDLATGKIVNSVAFTGAHDVAIGSDGRIYVAGYTSSNGIQSFNATLGDKHQLIASSAISRPTGISVVNNASGQTIGLEIDSQNSAHTQNGPDSVDYFSLSGSGDTATAAIVTADSGSSSLLKFSFGNAIAPDGNVYTAELGNVFGSNANYTGGIYEFNTTTLATSLAVAGEATNSSGGLTGTLGLGGLEAPKYLQFNTNFISAPDAGYPYTPEPGAMATLVGIVLSGSVFLRRKK